MASVVQFHSHGHRGRRRIMAEINVTPFVDVMLVLLIVFMVTAPLLTAGVPVDLPKTHAQPLGQDREPLSVTIRNNGRIYLQNTPVTEDDLVPRLTAIAARHDTTLAVVAPGIAQALFATAMGLLAAIPAVIFYNRFVNEIGRYTTRLDAFADEFSAILSRQLDERVAH